MSGSVPGKWPAVPGARNSETPANTGLFRVFRVFRLHARIHASVFFARAHHKKLSRVYIKSTRNTRNSQCSCGFRPEHTPGTRPEHPELNIYEKDRRL